MTYTRSASGDTWYRALAIVPSLIWGGNVVAVRISLIDLPPLSAAAARLVIATLVLVIWPSVRRGHLDLGTAGFGPILLLSVFNVAFYGFYYAALSLTTASHAAVLVYLYPILTACLAGLTLSEDRLNRWMLLGLLLAFGGAAVTIGTERESTGQASLVGDLLALCSAFFWAVSTVYAKRYARIVGPVAMLWYPAAMAAVALSVASMLLERASLDTISWRSVIALGYQGILAGAAGSILWLVLLRELSAGVLSSYTFLTPVFGVFASALLLDEPIGANVASGGFLVAAGLYVIDRGRKRRRACRAFTYATRVL